MTLFDSSKAVRCKKCRENLFFPDEYPLIDCHKKLLGIMKHISTTNSDESLSNIEPREELICETQKDNSMIFLNEEAYPLFIENAINEALWQKGKLYCPKCNSRIGNFNFINGSHCSCQLSLLPAVHLHISKIDYIRPFEQVFPVLSMPLSNNIAGSSGENLSSHSSSTSYVDENPVANLAATINCSLDMDQPDDEDVALMKQTAKAYENSVLEVQVRGIIDSSNCDHYLNQENANKYPEEKASMSVQVRLEDDITPHGNEGHLRMRKSWRKSQSSTSPSIPSFANHDLPNIDEDKEETHLLNLCDSSEDLSQPSTFHVHDNLAERESEAKVGENTSDEKFSAVFPDNLICAVCLDLLYSPFVVKPCSHIFCEPCLRRLAKPSPTNTSCPLCRELIGLCNPCHEISREIKEKFPEHNKERHKFEKLHDSQNMPLPWLRDYRFFGFRGRLGHANYGRNWTGWRTILWIFILDCLGLSLVLVIKWILGDYEANLQQIELQSKQRTLDTQSSLELESSYPSSQEFLDISNDSFFENIVE